MNRLNDTRVPSGVLRARLVALVLVGGLVFAVVFGLRTATSDDLVTGSIVVSVGGSDRNSFFNENAVGDFRGAFRARDVLERTSARTGLTLAELRAGLATSRIGSDSRLVSVTFRHADGDVVAPALDTVVDEVDLWLRRARAAEQDAELLPELAAAKELIDDLADVTIGAGVVSVLDARRRSATDVRITESQLGRVEAADPGGDELAELLERREAELDQIASFVPRYRIVADEYDAMQLPLIRAETQRALLAESLSIATPLGPAIRTGRRASLVGDVRAGLSAAGIAVLVELGVFWLLDRRRRDGAVEVSPMELAA